MGIGAYRHRVQLEHPAVVLDPATWDCSLQSAASQVIDGLSAFFVRGRFHPGITIETQITFEGRTFQVQSVTDLDERHTELQLMCVEVVGRGTTPGGTPIVTAPPTLTAPPVGTSVPSGQSATLTVVAAGTPPLAYQWTKAGVDIAGATNQFYVTGPLTVTTSYAVRVSNAYGSVTSSAVTVTVVAATLTYQQQVVADGAVAYWPLDDASGVTARDLVGTRHGTITGGVALNQSGMGTSHAMSFDGSTGFISLPALPPLYPAYSYEAWVYVLATGDIQVVIQRGNAGAAGHGMHSVTNLIRMSFDGYPSLPNVSSPSSFPQSSWHHCVWTNDGSVLRFNLDGVLTNQVAMVLPVEGAPSAINRIGTYAHTAGGWLKGKLQDIAIYPRALTLAEIAAHYDLRA